MLFAFRIALLILFALTCHIYRFHLQCTISLVSNIKGLWFCNRFFRGKLSWRVCSFFIIATAITIITITMVVVTAIIGMIDIPTVTYSFQITSRWFLHRCPCYLCHHYIIFVSSKPMGGTYHHHHDTMPLGWSSGHWPKKPVLTGPIWHPKNRRGMKTIEQSMDFIKKMMNTN